MFATIFSIALAIFIASLGPLLMVAFNYQRWQDEQRLQRLREKRERTEKQFLEIMKKCRHLLDHTPVLVDGEFESIVEFSLPDIVYSTINEFVLKVIKVANEENKTINPEEINTSLYTITSAMRGVIDRIDKDIDLLLNQKHTILSLLKSLFVSCQTYIPVNSSND